jgi:hypothetical protein
MPAPVPVCVPDLKRCATILSLLLCMRAAAEVTPWFTGTLLAPSGYIVPEGYYNIEPYLFATNVTGVYDREWRSRHQPSYWLNDFQLEVQVGMTKKTSFFIFPQAFYNYDHGAHALNVGDLALGVQYQLHTEHPNQWYPAVKFVLQELLPTGKYQKLNPHKKSMDGMGLGTYQTSAALCFSRLSHLGGIHYCNTHFSIGYGIGTVAHVKGLNTYGGDQKTRGKVKPGNVLSAILGFELSLTRQIALALDILNLYANKTHFSGKTRLPVGIGSSNQFSLAPAIEYNFNEKSGLIAGLWFTAAGRNTPDFKSWTIAYNYYGAMKGVKIAPPPPGGSGGGRE